jgi:glyoxylate reductase
LKFQVLLTRRIPSAVLSRLESHCTVDLYDGRSPITADQLAARLPGKDALICLLTDPVTEDVLAAGTSLEVVSNIAVGYDNIDVKAARARGIVVTNTPDVLTEAVAEFTWGLILASARRIAEGDRLVRRGAWQGWALDFMLGTELRGKQLGILGRGRIGRAVAARAPAFGMHVVFGHTAARKPSADSVPIDELLVGSDVISIHTPATAETRHLIDRRALMRMKRSADAPHRPPANAAGRSVLAWRADAAGDPRRTLAGRRAEYREDSHLHARRDLLKPPGSRRGRVRAADHQS